MVNQGGDSIRRDSKELQGLTRDPIVRRRETEKNVLREDRMLPLRCGGHNGQDDIPDSFFRVHIGLALLLPRTTARRAYSFRER